MGKGLLAQWRGRLVGRGVPGDPGSDPTGGPRIVSGLLGNR